MIKPLVVGLVGLAALPLVGAVSTVQSAPPLQVSSSHSFSVSMTPDSFAEFPVPTFNSGTANIVLGPDDNLWFTEERANKIGRVTQRGIIDEFPIPRLDSHPVGIAFCNNMIWFTESFANAIGRFDLDGRNFKDYVLPNSPNFPWGITCGSDGKVWFTERAGNRIGSIDPRTGKITQSGYVNNPLNIVLGPDNNLWFTEGLGNKIGSISPATWAITEFQIPTPNSGAYGITIGQDDNIWFTEISSRKIGHVLPSGAIEEFSLSIENEFPNTILQGHGGVLWFTLQSGNAIFFIDPFTKAIQPLGNLPSRGIDDLVMGRDGRLWFMESRFNRVGRMAVQ